MDTPSNAGSGQSLGLPDLRSSADKAYDSGDFAEALARYRQILEHGPDVHALNRIGAILAQQGNLIEAEKALVDALALDPNHAPAHSNLGNVLYRKGEYEAALSKYQLAANLDPSNPVYYSNLHAALKKLGRLSQAVAMIKKAHSMERHRVRQEARERWRGIRQVRGCGPTAAAAFLMLAAIAFALGLS